MNRKYMPESISWHAQLWKIHHKSFCYFCYFCYSYFLHLTKAQAANSCHTSSVHSSIRRQQCETLTKVGHACLIFSDLPSFMVDTHSYEVCVDVSIIVQCFYRNQCVVNWNTSDHPNSEWDHEFKMQQSTVNTHTHWHSVVETDVIFPQKLLITNNFSSRSEPERAGTHCQHLSFLFWLLPPNITLYTEVYSS